MADFNRVGNPMLASGIGRLYGVDFPSLPVVGSEIQVVTSPWERAEFWALLGGGLGWGNVEMPGPGAGNFNACELRNPVGSGVLLILDAFQINNDEAGVRSFRWGYRNISLGELTTSTGAWVNRDLRRAATTGGSGGLAGRIRTQTSVGASTFSSITGRVTLPASSSSPLYAGDVVLPPGWGFMLQNVTANEQLAVNFWGRERAAPAAEIGSL